MAPINTETNDFRPDRDPLLELVTAEAGLAVAVIDQRLACQFATPLWHKFLGLPPGDLAGKPAPEIFGELWPQIKSPLDRALAGERTQFELILPTYLGAEGDTAVVTVRPAASGSGALLLLAPAASRGKEDDTRFSELHYRDLLDSIDVGFCVIEVIFNEQNEPVNYRFIKVNEAFERQTGLANATGKTMRELTPTHEQSWFETYGRVARTGEPVRFQSRAAALQRWFDVYAFSVGAPRNHRVALLFNDITVRKEAEAVLARRAEEQSALYEFLDRINRGGTLEEIYDSALDSILKAMKCSRASILLFDRAGVMQFVAWRHLSDPYREAVKGHSPWLAEERDPRPICISDTGVAEVSPALTEVINHEGIRALAFIPLMAGGRLIGKFMTYHDVPHEFTKGELELASTIASQLGVVMEHKRDEESKARLAAIVEFSEDAIISKDANGIIVTWNRGAERLFGYTAAEAVGRSIKLIIPQDRLPEEDVILSRVRRREPVEHYETIRRRKDGKLLDISLTVSPLVDQAGNVIGASKIARDITERTQADVALRESEDRYRTLVKQVKDYAIFRMDKSGRPTSWNEGVERVFGFTEAEFIGRDIATTIFTPEDIAAGVPERELQTAAETGTANNDRWLRRKDGTRFFASGTTTGLRDSTGKHIGFSKVVRDDTAAKQSEEALATAQAKLQEYAINLEQTVAQRTHDLRATNEQLEAFVYSVAHDLRNPLRALTGYSQLLLSGRGGELPESARELLQRIQTSSEFMDRLLLDLLAYGRSARAELDLGPVEVLQAWEAAQFQCSAQINETKAQIETVAPLPIVRAHEGTLGQCLANLLSNALKFVEPGITPKIRLWAEDGSDCWRIWIEDNGLGIPRQHQERIFRVFERLHGSRYVGTGVGLSIVRKGIERMGGHVGLVSEPGQGSKFWIELPKG